MTDRVASTTALVPADRALIDLGAIHRYQVLWDKVLTARARYNKLYRFVLDTCNKYYDAHEGLCELIKKLRYAIRMQTRGTPATIALDSITTAGYIPNGTERLYNAHGHLIKNAYRLVAALVHPDKGGDREVFQSVLTAYRLGDLTFLQELYLRLTKDSLFWRSSQDSVLYCEQEIERPRISLSILQQTAEFQIARMHQMGNYSMAAHFAELRLVQLSVELQKELADL